MSQAAQQTEHGGDEREQPAEQFNALQRQVAELQRRLAEAERSEAAAREAAQRYDELLRISPHGVMVQEQGRISYINERGWRMLGACSAEELIGCQPKDFVDPEYAELFWQRDSVLLEHGVTPTQRFRLRRLDGGVLDVEVASVRFESTSGHATQTVFQDIGERLQLEQQAEDYAERYRIIDAMSQDYIYLDRIEADGSMTPLWVTSSFESMTGYSVQEAQDTDLLKRLAHPDDLEAFMAHYRQLLGGQAGDFTGRLIHKDGGLRWVRHLAWPVTDEVSGRVSMLYGCVRDVTDWVEAAEEARDYSERYRVISQMSEDFSALVELGESGALRMLWVTQAFERLTGYTLDDVNAPDFLTAAMPDFGEHSLLRQIEALRAGVGSAVEGPLQTKWGAVIWVRSTLRPFDDPVSGRRLAFFSARDITRRRMAEAALRNSEQQLRVAQRVGKIGSWEFDYVEESMLWSAEMYRIYGVDAEHFTPSLDSALQLAVEEDRAAMLSEQEAAVAEGRMQYAVEFRVQPPGGELRVILNRVELLRDDKGQVHRAIGTSQDVTEERRRETALQAAYQALAESHEQLQGEIAERKAAETAARESEERFRKLLESMDEGVILADFEERHLYANPAAERIYGVAAGELLSRPIEEFIDQMTMQRFKVETEIRRRGEHSQYEFEIMRPDGVLRRLRNSVSPVRNASGEVVASMGVFTDITEEATLRERLLNEQREESIIMLAGGIAHDFNNMLMGVLGASALIEAGLPREDSSNRELAHVVHTSASRMADLTNKLLAYARGGKYQTRRFDINQSVKNAELMVRGNLPARVSIELELGQDLPQVEADMGQIEQVLLNLLVNAIEAVEANGHGTGLIRVTTGSEPCGKLPLLEARKLRSTHCLRVSVVDTGCGMSAETLERIFEPFFSTKFQGRGLGLAACSGIVRNHEGALWAESTPGQGSVFHLALPALWSGAVPDEEDVEQHASAGVRMLVIDDDPQALHITRRMLESRGYQVETAGSGTEGLELWHAQRSGFDLILLDMQMQDMSGAEVLRLIRREDDAARVLICSGFTAEAMVQDLHDLHPAGFLPKPFGPRDLTRAVEEALLWTAEAGS